MTAQLVVLTPGDVAGVFNVNCALGLMLHWVVVPTLGLQELEGVLLKNREPEFRKEPGEFALMLPDTLQLTGTLP